jgi:hypothetical protein
MLKICQFNINKNIFPGKKIISALSDLQRLQLKFKVESFLRITMLPFLALIFIWSTAFPVANPTPPAAYTAYLACPQK